MDTRTCVLNLSDIFYILIILVVSFPIGFLINSIKSNCCNNGALFWIFEKLKFITAFKSQVAKFLELFITAKLMFLLCALVNLLAPPAERNGFDDFSYILSVLLLVSQVIFICGVIPYVLYVSWHAPKDKRHDKIYP